MEIEIPPSLLHGETWGRWRIARPTEKLLAKYGLTPPTSFHTVEFDRYAAARVAADPSWADRIEGADLAATVLMHSRIRDQDITAIMSRAQKIQKALEAVPRSLSLETARFPLILLFRACAGIGGVSLAKITKLLSLKRPRLVPMLDSYVMGFLFKSAWPRPLKTALADAGPIAVEHFHSLLHHGENRAVLAASCTRVTQRLASGRAPVRLSLVRALESLLWFDWEGYRQFGWALTKGRVLPGG